MRCNVLRVLSGGGSVCFQIGIELLLLLLLLLFSAFDNDDEVDAVVLIAEMTSCDVGDDVVPIHPCRVVGIADVVAGTDA